MINIYAGPTALATINAEGFSHHLFTTMLGASGGPKWFTLFGLDKYFFTHFFKRRETPLNIVGSSAGAFRAACFGQKDPVAATKRLAEHYSHTVYSSNKPTAKEITQKAKEVVDVMLGNRGVSEIVNNPIIRAHFIVAKCNGFCASENKAMQSLGLALSLIRNRSSRKYLTPQYERFIFANQASDFSFNDLDGFTNHTVFLNDKNLKQALLASGSIPMVMEGIKNIYDCPTGMYRDGGIIDYHFDLKIKNKGLVIYPHFSNKLRSGWFDKNLSRHVSQDNYDNAVVICPSEAFIKTLPNQKIPDREDFTNLPANQRISNWQTVFKESEKLAEHFHEFIETQALNNIKPMSELIKN